MTGPSWVPGIFAAIMIAVAAVSAARLAIAARSRHQPLTGSDADAAHLLMAIAMAGMLATSLHTLPTTAWEVIFALMTAWFAGRVAREERGRGPRGWASGCHSPHLVHSAAMVYMFAALATPGRTSAAASGMSGGAGSLHAPVLALVLALLLAGYAVRDLDRLTDAVGAGFYHPAPAPHSPRTAALATAGSTAPPAGNRLTATLGGDGQTRTAPATARPAAIAGEPPGTNQEDQPARPGHKRTLDRGYTILTSPQMATTGRIAMGITMAYMLIMII